MKLIKSAIIIILFLGLIKGKALASVEGGTASIFLLPETDKIEIGQNNFISVHFNTNGIPISAVTLRLSYPFSGSTPEVVASQIAINQDLLSADWTCPIKTINQVEGKVQIDISCLTINTTGYNEAGDKILVSFLLTPSRIPTDGKITIKFDPALTVISRKSDGVDILKIPVSQGVYEIIPAVKIAKGWNTAFGNGCTIYSAKQNNWRPVVLDFISSVFPFTEIVKINYLCR